jgi:hypothetical protein
VPEHQVGAEGGVFSTANSNQQELARICLICYIPSTVVERR